VLSARGCDTVGRERCAFISWFTSHSKLEFLTTNITTEQMDVTNARYGDDFCVIEHQWTGTVPGEFLGIPGNGKRISFRMLHVWDFKDGRISRENAWLDGNAIVAQLTA
jgi:steroid delta-isomerase-like uncharacterized protein